MSDARQIRQRQEALDAAIETLGRDEEPAIGIGIGKLVKAAPGDPWPTSGTNIYLVQGVVLVGPDMPGIYPPVVVTGTPFRAVNLGGLTPPDPGTAPTYVLIWLGATNCPVFLY